MPRAKQPKPTTLVRSWKVEVPGWTPTSLNKLMGPWKRGYGLKLKDARVIGQACGAAGVPRVGLTKAERKDRKEAGIKGPLPGDPEPRKRHVRLEITLGKGQRTLDSDNCWKSALDSLKSAGVLFDDSRRWCSHESEPIYHRGTAKDDKGTVIHIEEYE